MGINLMEISNYGIITFGSTSYALKAEKTIKNMGTPFMIIPTPREISASCGLAIKLEPSFLDECIQILAREKVPIEEAYLIEEQDKKKILHKITWDQLPAD